MAVFWFLIIAALVTGCGGGTRQAQAEAKFASDVARWMEQYAVTSTAPVTNIAQIFPLVKHGYPFFHHYELSRFGDRAGFSKSVAEKYIFFVNPVTNRWAQGEVICMSVKPFQWGGEGPSRIYIAKLGTRYIFRDLPEHAVQVMLNEAQPNIVPLVVGPLPPRPPEVEQWSRPSLGDRYERLVWGISGALGQDSSVPVRTAISVLAGAVLLVLVCAFVLLMRRKPR
jgi:hypothetical protein